MTDVYFEKLLKEYKKKKIKYQLLADYLIALFKQIARELEIYPIIQGRAKSLESFAEKILRPNKNYKDPLNELTDLCGVRFVTHTLDEVDKVEKILEQYFSLDYQNCEDKQEKLAYREFGYLSRHFIIQLKLIKDIAGFNQEKIEELKSLKAELQLRTFAQHIWADIYHELGYKNEFKLPNRWEREFGRIAAMLENCDKSFMEIKADISSCESSFGIFMTKDELKSLENRLRILLKVDSENSQAFHRLIKAYTSLGKWQEIENMYKQYEKLAEENPGSLRDIGVAICKLNLVDHKKYSESENVIRKANYDSGQKLIKKAIAQKPNDVDSYCCLAGTYMKLENFPEAASYYKMGHQLDQTNPYPLGNYIACEILATKKPELVDYFYSLIKKSIQRCEKQIEIQANIPWAYYDLGMFHFYLKEIYQSIHYYTKALSKSIECWELETGSSRLNDFRDADIQLENLEIILRLLELGEWNLVRNNDKDKIIPAKDSANPFSKIPQKILILSGGCGGMEEPFNDQLKSLKEKLKVFDGTIISGGTMSGISALAGELQEEEKSLQTIGYLPDENSKVVKPIIDKRYKKRRPTTGQDFSVLEPLTFWADFICAGGNPQMVKLIGFNGGKISACEYRIALALGAEVGIVCKSGREADKLLKDPLWQENMNELALPAGRGKNLFALDLENDDIALFLKRYSYGRKQ